MPVVKSRSLEHYSYLFFLVHFLRHLHLLWCRSRRSCVFGSFSPFFIVALFITRMHINKKKLLHFQYTIYKYVYKKTKNE